MRIGLLCQSCDNRTGIGRIVNSLASEFSSLGHQVSCAAQFFDGTDERITRVQVPHLSSSKGLNKLLFRFNGMPFDRSKVDIVHTFGVGRGAHVVSAQSCHRAGMKLLSPLRSQLLERGNVGLYDRISLADERSLLTSPRTRRIIAVSRLVKSQVEEEYHVDPQLISVVPNGVNYKLLQELPDNKKRMEVRSRLGLSQSDFVLLFVGNEFGRKGLGVLLNAMKALRDKSLRLLVIGGGDQNAYARRASELGIADRVSFLGSVSNPETMYIAADAFVLPALYEPFGIVILEAMGAGVPVITSKSCGATEGMQHRRHVLHLDDLTSPEKLAEAIRMLRRDEVLRRTLIAAGVEKAKEFSWDRIARMMLAVYDEARRSS
ncbi:MAG: hypothetical protein HW412_2314 [Bacteroidetes bacterium]|nr:hypothetical protein [Bacteroidota bacterium]